jgi:5-amino-6-(5-phosphoribosylamino)uracil reductase/diaminohydroxyphosphoribosylaminopyrimidine deaminase/5-amino-6-(5-phosphoribosylamino)uracil reductase
MPRPLVTLSYAQTLDGRLATRHGSSQWISGPESLQFSHTQRAAHAAIMVGVNTVLADDPRLTVRLVAGRDPLRVVVDSHLRIPLTAGVLRDGAATGTLIAAVAPAPPAARTALSELGATVLELPAGPDGLVDLAVLLDELGARHIPNVMVEGGAALITNLLRTHLADRLAVTIAPKILGTGISAIGDLGLQQLADAFTLHEVTVTPYGVDLVVEGRIGYPEPAETDAA